MSLHCDPRTLAGRRARDARRLDLGEIAVAFGSADPATATHIGLDAPHGFVVVPLDDAALAEDGSVDLPIRGDLIAAAPTWPRDVELDQETERRVAGWFDGLEAATVLREERIDVSTRQVPAERVRLRKEVVTEQVMVPVTIRRERLVVDREPVAEAPAAGEAPFAPADDVEWILWAEEPVVTTRAVPVERVRLRKETSTETVTVTEPLRHEEAVLDRDER